MQSRKLDSLTGLRFFAALMVFISHAAPIRGAWPFYTLGPAGVVLFFTLSGFVITYNYFDRFHFQNSYKSNLKSFFISRFARIYPLHFLLFLFGFLLNYNALSVTIPFVLTLTHAWFGSNALSRVYNPVSWSLSVEFFLYLSFPFLIIPLLKFASSAWKLILSGAVVYLSTMIYLLVAQVSSTGSLTAAVDSEGPVYYVIYTCPLTHLSDFLIGCIAARILMLGKPLDSKLKKLSATPVMAATSALAIYLMFQSLFPILFFGNFVTPLLAIIIFNLARYRTLPGSILSSKLFVLLGEASFAFYMVHSWVIYFLRTTFLIDYTNPLTLLSLVAILLAATVLSILLYYFVETPCRKFIVSRFAIKKGGGTETTTVKSEIPASFIK